MQDLVNILNNDSKVSMNLCGKPDSICVTEVKGQKLILINVPPAEPSPPSKSRAFSATCHAHSHARTPDRHLASIPGSAPPGNPATTR